MLAAHSATMTYHAGGESTDPCDARAAYQGQMSRNSRSAMLPPSSARRCLVRPVAPISDHGQLAVSQPVRATPISDSLTRDS